MVTRELRIDERSGCNMHSHCKSMARDASIVMDRLGPLSPVYARASYVWEQSYLLEDANGRRSANDEELVTLWGASLDKDEEHLRFVVVCAP